MRDGFEKLFGLGLALLLIPARLPPILHDPPVRVDNPICGKLLQLRPVHDGGPDAAEIFLVYCNQAGLAMSSSVRPRKGDSVNFLRKRCIRDDQAYWLAIH
jgi:hypothetical protein